MAHCEPPPSLRHLALRPDARTPHSTSSNLTTLADRGHFLKSSSASLGIYKVQEACGKIEQYGKKVADDGSSLEKDDALKLIDALLKKVKVDNDAAETWLDEWYERDGNAT